MVTYNRLKNYNAVFFSYIHIHIQMCIEERSWRWQTEHEKYNKLFETTENEKSAHNCLHDDGFVC